MIASLTFPRVTADLRRDLFRHLMGHAPSYFADRLPGTLTSRISATSNAVFTLENMFAWNVLPPMVGNLGRDRHSRHRQPGGDRRAGPGRRGMVLVIFRLAAAAKPLHRVFADKAAAVDGEMVDVIGNMAIVRAFGGIRASTAPGAARRSTGRRRRGGGAFSTWTGCGCSIRSSSSA